MTDKTKNTGDEYQFPHDEYVAAESDTQQPNYDAFKGEESTATEESAVNTQKPGLLERFPILQNKRVLTVVGVVVVAVIAFQIMTPSHKTTVIKQAQPTQQSASSLQAQQQQSALLDKVNRISQAATDTQGVENQLQNEVGGLKATLDKTNESNLAMRKAVIALADQVAHLSKQLKKATTKPNHIKKLPPSPVLTFHLRAIIPGRAWIEGSNGETDSVAVGTKVKNYGTVKAIDVTAGKVVTSSGKEIAYNSDGN